jgi:hypothetical protein
MNSRPRVKVHVVTDVPLNQLHHAVDLILQIQRTKARGGP